LLEVLDASIRDNKMSATPPDLAEPTTPREEYLKENIDSEFYPKVVNSQDYHKRKAFILSSLEKLEEKVSKSAKTYDEMEKLNYIVREKA
jgi:hypothetical protein